MPKLQNDHMGQDFFSDFYDCTGGPTLVLTRPATYPSARSGSRLPASALAQSSTRSNGGASAAQVGEAAGHAQPSAVPATACCTAADRMLHHRRAHPHMATRRTAGGARCARARTRFRTRPMAPAGQSAVPLRGMTGSQTPESNVLEQPWVMVRTVKHVCTRIDSHI